MPTATTASSHGPSGVWANVRSVASMPLACAGSKCTAAMTMKTLGDAVTLRNRLIEKLEEAEPACAVNDRESLLTFVVAGAGFAGVETVGSMYDFLQAALPHYRNLKPTMIRVVLVHPGTFVLPDLGEDLGRYASRKLAQRGVEIHPNTKIKAVTPTGVELSDGTQIDTQVLVWTAGTAPHPLLEQLALPKQRNRLKVDSTLAVTGYTGVWALGDCALIPDVKAGFQPPTAQHASREGKILARNIVVQRRGQALIPFKFRTLGYLASIGHRTGVARILGINFSGFVAWWLWRTIYLLKLPRIEKKLRVALDWTLDVFFSKDLVQYLHRRQPITADTSANSPDTRCFCLSEQRLSAPSTCTRAERSAEPRANPLTLHLFPVLTFPPIHWLDCPHFERLRECSQGECC